MAVLPYMIRQHYIIFIIFQSVLYASDTKSLSVWWTGYEDPESGIASIEIALYQDVCSTREDTIVRAFESLPFNETNFLYLGLVLQVIIYILLSNYEYSKT